MADPGLVEVAAAGKRLATLRSLRDLLAREIATCDSKRDVAALSQRLMDVLEQIESAEKSEPAAKGSVADEVSRRRAERAAGKAGSAGGRQRRA